MIKIKTKRIKENAISEYVKVNYKTKNTNAYEHLILIKHLILKVLATKEYSREELLKLLKMYL